jgi:hypothetical protein
MKYMLLVHHDELAMTGTVANMTGASATRKAQTERS